MLDYAGSKNAAGARPKEPLHISGAGPAGLAAAIAYARAGGTAIVHERKPTVGARFHGDFQGLENWTAKGDVLDELQRIGIEPDFPHAPFRELVAFDPSGREFRCTSQDPIFYLVSRGDGPDTLDTALLKQARGLGVEIRFNDAVKKLPEGGIAAEGPHGGDVIAAGFLFETDMADGAYAALSDDLAPKGYAYLLIHQGRATLATCMFDDFHRENIYLQRTADFFQRAVGCRMASPKRFGGLGNVSYPTSARKDNILYAGEAAGFQDALWGFGMRYAITSGHLASRAWLMGQPEAYDRLWRKALGSKLKAGAANRYGFSRLGNAGYTLFLQRLSASPDVRIWLQRHYKPSVIATLLFPLARRALPGHGKQRLCVMPNCTCTWCRCHRGKSVSHPPGAAHA